MNIKLLKYLKIKHNIIHSSGKHFSSYLPIKNENLIIILFISSVFFCIINEDQALQNTNHANLLLR